VSRAGKGMEPSTYRDMHLLDAVTHSPDLTQRELAKRIGVALGLTNLMLRRLIKKGYIKISGTKRSRIRYLITPQGILEKSRLTYEFVQYSLQLYSRIRQSLRAQLALLAQEGKRRILLCGTDELAEIAFLTIREMGLELVGVVAEPPDPARFLSCPVQHPTEVQSERYDRILIASLRGGQDEARQLLSYGVPAVCLIIVSPAGIGTAQPGTDQQNAAPLATAPLERMHVGAA